ncbi:MAG: ABC transporter ATP-binding protein [Actinobacteria bacterium]|nr:ABC transporter ATP-binding protein [Actinomycetota bacterium]
MLTITGLHKTFPAKAHQEKVAALDDINITVNKGEFFTLLGPSGCGKTTTLRCVAGLETPDSGEIVVAGQPFFSSESKRNVPANDRGLGMVFQSYAIWPHMDVAENVAFPLKARPRGKRPGKAEIDRKVDAALETVELSQAKKRRATDLSGGQQQRLALARALVMESPLTLFDEPLSNLDAKLRDGMRFELKRLQRELGITAIYVTHDQAEALAMSSRIAIMKAGHIEQLGRPREIYETPESLFVADFIGTSNFFPGEVVRREESGVYLVRTEAGEVVAGLDGERSLPNASKVTVAVRPQHISIDKEPAAVSAPGRWPGVVRTRAYLGEYVDHVVQVGEHEVRVRGDSRTSLAPGTEVLLSMDAASCSLLPQD